MKKIILILLLIPAYSYAQKDKKITIPTDSSDNRITYTEIVDVPGLSKNELYIKSKEWFAKNFVSSQHVIQLDDRETGKIIGKGSAKGNFSILISNFSYFLNYTISVTVKDNKYRFVINQFNVEHIPERNVMLAENYLEAYKAGKGIMFGPSKKIIPFINENATGFLNSFKAAMKSNKIKDDF